MAAQGKSTKIKSLRRRLHGFDPHKPDHCPICVLGIGPMEPYMDSDGTDVECSRCFDARIVCLICEKADAEYQHDRMLAAMDDFSDKAEGLEIPYRDD